MHPGLFCIKYPHMNIRAIPYLYKSKVICIFVSKPDEPETHRLIKELLLTDKIVCVPRVVGQNLNLYRIRLFNQLEIGSFGVLEPENDLPVVEPTDVEVFLVPGKKFDRRGNRKGRGKGYYDRLLAYVPGVKIGVAFEKNIVDSIDPQPHDIPMDYVVTETHVYSY